MVALDWAPCVTEGKHQVMEDSRVERRKARTRAALVRAALDFVANGNVNAPVLEITQAADVGNGSFYNYFASKEELWSAAVDEALASVGAYLDTLTVGLDDPVEKFTQSFRLSGRLFRMEPQLSRVLLTAEAAVVASERGLAPRSRRDIESATKQGRFDVEDSELALALVSGTLLSMGRLLLEDSDRDEASTVDRTTVRVLRALGVPACEAEELCSKALPQSYRGALHTVIAPASVLPDGT